MNQNRDKGTIDLSRKSGKAKADWNENRCSSAGQGRVGHLRRDVRTRKHKEERHLLRKCPRVTKVRSPYMVNSGGTEMLV